MLTITVQIGIVVFIKIVTVWFFDLWCSHSFHCKCKTVHVFPVYNKQDKTFSVVIDKLQMCFKVAVLKITQNILLMRLLKDVKSSVWIRERFPGSTCDNASFSLQLLLLCSDQKVWFRSNRARSPASTPSALLHRGREDHLSSQCVHLLPIYLSILHLLHQIPRFPFIFSLSALFFSCFHSVKLPLVFLFYCVI